jgi:two-component system KDP operon response regulator KdpE
VTASRGRVLVCDDESQILRALRVVLREADYDVVPASTAAEALDLAAVQRLDAAIVDIMLPDGDGVEVARQIREWSPIPILVLSAIGEEDEKVRALQAGADDYVTKPFGPKELIARLEAALRRAEPGGQVPVIESGDLSLDVAAHVVSRGGTEIHLTPTEFDLLKALMVNRGRLMTHAALLKEVWGPAYADDIATLRTHMVNLRRKIETGEGGPRIHTEAGVGYRFTG